MRTMAKRRAAAVLLVLMASSIISASHSLIQRNMRASTRGASRIVPDPVIDEETDRRLPFYSGSKSGCGKGKGKGKGKEKVSHSCSPSISPGIDNSSPAPADNGSTPPPANNGIIQPVSLPPSPTRIPTEPTTPPAGGGGSLPSPNAVPSDFTAGEPTSKPVEPTSLPSEPTTPPTDNNGSGSIGPPVEPTPPAPVEPTSPPGGSTGPPSEPTSTPGGSSGPPNEPTSAPGGGLTGPPSEPTLPGGSSGPPNSEPTLAPGGSTGPPSEPTLPGGSSGPPNDEPTMPSNGSGSPAPVVPTGDGIVSPGSPTEPSMPSIGSNSPAPDAPSIGDGSTGLPVEPTMPSIDSGSPAPATPTGDGMVSPGLPAEPTAPSSGSSSPASAAPTGDGGVVAPGLPGSSPPPTTSAAPSTSSAPSVTPPYETEETPNGDGIVSTCKVDPPAERPAPKVLTANYTYVVLVTNGTNITQALNDVEYETHGALVSELLSCVFSAFIFRRLQDTGVEYTFISSLPQDTPSNQACQNVPPDQDCYVVDGGVTVGYLSPQEESVILEEIGDVLVENYDGGIIADQHPDIVALDFIAFDDEDTTDDGSGGGPSAIIGDDDTSSDKSRGRIAGVAVISASVVALAVLVLLLIRRRRRDSNTSYAEDGNFSDKGSLLDEDSTDSQEDSTTIPAISGDSTLSTTYIDANPQHDVKVCGSSLCPACCVEGPVFVPSTKIPAAIQDIGPQRLSEDSARPYAMTDTVDL